MNKKKKRLSMLCLIFFLFLFLCTVINIAGGHIGGAMAGFGAGIFFLSFYLVYKGKENKK